MTGEAPTVAVVGGGIAGASVALQLAERTDRRVVVYERGDVAGETTARSAAFFGFYGSELERCLKREGMARYNALLASPEAEPRHDLLGRLDVATTADGARRLRERLAAEAPGDPVRYLDPEDVHATVLLPELDAGPVAGATYRPGVGYHRPRELAREFVARAVERGVAVHTGTRVVDVGVEDGRVAGLTVERGDNTETVRPRAVVLAAGPWTRRLAASAGVELPLAHSLAPILRLRREGHAPHVLPIVVHEESGVYVRGHGTDSVLVGRMPTGPVTEPVPDPDAVGDEVPPGDRQAMRRVVDDLLPALAGAPVHEEWVGVRSHTPDGHPVIGWTAVAGLSVVAFDSSGIQLAPAAGRIVSRQLVDGRPTEVHDAVSVARFDGHGEAPFSLDGAA